MMKVLHIVSKDDSLTTHYVSTINKYMSQQIESVLVDSTAAYRKVCKSWTPDIIHQYGSAEVQGSAFRRVISPNGLPVSGKSYYAIVARSPIEAERLGKEGVKRIEIVRNPMITKTTNFDETARKMLYVYQKVMDSNPLPLMNDETKTALSVLLKVGVCKDKRWITRKLAIPSVNFRLLYIYAKQEGVLPIIERGIKFLEIDAPPRENISSYLPPDYKNPVSMTGKAIDEMVKDIRVNGLSLLRMADLYEALLDDRLNEDNLVETLEQDNNKLLFSSILTIMSEQLLLDEGFMPCPPIENRETKQLRQNLLNHLRL